MAASGMSLNVLAMQLGQVGQQLLALASQIDRDQRNAQALPLAEADEIRGHLAAARDRIEMAQRVARQRARIADAAGRGDALATDSIAEVTK